MNFFSRSISRTFLLYLLLLLLALEAIGASNPVEFNPQKGDRLVFLGNTFADRMRYYDYFETYLQKSFPDRQLSVRNMGWSADEVALQPRPLNFPGLPEKEAENTAVSKEVRFEAWSKEKVVMPVALNFAGLHQDLADQKADIIFLCFGMNESFKGEAGLQQFQKDLITFIQTLAKQRYNGRSAPQLILVSPIAHENLGAPYPNPEAHNASLVLYTRVMQQVAEENGLLFVDLFAPSAAWMNTHPGERLTINGIHLNEKGYREAGRWMAQALGFGGKVATLNLASENSLKLREVIKMKNTHFLYRWRAVNGEYIYGRRREPFGVLAFPPELRKIEQMVAKLDEVIWQMSKSTGSGGYHKALAIVDQRGKAEAVTVVPGVTMMGKQAHQHEGAEAQQEEKLKPASTAQFTVAEGYEVNLFASEKDFPVEKPVSMAFDAQGRLWVASMTTYPQYYPGIPPHDKIVILEDSDHNGRADKHTVFADNLYLPLGFEFGNGGIYVSQEPDLHFLKDTDGDGKADQREVVLMGFGTEDSHHAVHTFTYGQDGALYFNEGTFLNSQIETPYGPVRSYAGTTYRFEPRTGKLSDYLSYGYDNPWGNLFDRWGTHLIADASNGSNYFAPPLTGKVDYPAKHTPMNTFTTTRVRPTAGIEIISSRHFPESAQGNLLINNTIGFQGIKQHQILEQGSGITSKEAEPLLQSSDPAFRPVDLKFGPDGALYVLDWYNPIISHGENPPRDPGRDKVHGRIWRITYKHKPLLTPVDVSRQSLPQLLDNLKAPEDRFRYRSRAQIRQQAPEQVLPALQQWVSMLDKNSSEYEHHLLEALWLYQDFQTVREDLLQTLLQAKNYKARAAATRVLFYWRDRLPDALDLFRARINDESPRVRLEALVALSHFGTQDAAAVAAEVFRHPTDYYLDYAIKETFGYLKPVWMAGFATHEQFLADNPGAAMHLLRGLSAEELGQLPQSQTVLQATLMHVGVPAESRKEAVVLLAQKQQVSPVTLLLQAIQMEPTAGADELRRLLASWNKAELKAHRQQLLELLHKEAPTSSHAAAYAALIKAEGSDKSVWKIALQQVSSLESYLQGLGLLQDPELQASFYPKVRKMTQQVPKKLSKKYSEAGQQGSASPFYPVHAAAYRVLFDLPGHDQEKSQLLAGLISPDGAYLDLALKALSSGLDSQRTWAGMSPVVKKLLIVAEQTPEPERKEARYEATIALGKRLARLLPQAEGEPLLAALESMSTLELKLSAVPSKMLFDQEAFTVPAGRSVSLLFENPDGMPHNVVIVQPGSTEKVGLAADAMARLKDGFEKHFVPAIPEVLFATPLVNKGQSFRLDFKAPDTPGDYPFICSFPGHWRMMKGVLKVVNPPMGKSD